MRATKQSPGATHPLLLVFFPAMLAGCPQAVAPLNPGDRAPGTRQPDGTERRSTGACCEIGRPDRNQRIVVPATDAPLTPQCVNGRAATSIRVMGSVSACAGSTTTVTFDPLTLVVTFDDTPCGGTAGIVQQSCVFHDVSYNASVHFEPEYSCVQRSGVEWQSLVSTPGATDLYVFCSTQAEGFLLQGLDSAFIDAAVAGMDAVKDETATLPTCPLAALGSGRSAPRCDDWEQR